LQEQIDQKAFDGAPRFYVEHLAVDFWRGGRIFKHTKKGFKKRGARKASLKKDPG